MIGPWPGAFSVASCRPVSDARHRFPVPQLLFILTAGAFVWAVRHSLPLLPERVATHFGAHGEANGWLTREGHVRFMLGFGLGLSGFLIVLLHGVRFLPARALNLPDADFWRSPGHFPEACRTVARWSWLLGALQLLFLGLLNETLVAANQLSPPRLPGAMLFWPLGIFLTGTAVLIFGLLQSLRRSRAALTASI